jgi:hypothetical protein
LFFAHAAYFNTEILPQLECGWPDAYDELLQLPEQGINHRERENAIARLNQMLYGASMPDEDRAALELARKVLQRRGEVKANDAYVIVNIRLNHRDQL